MYAKENLTDKYDGEQQEYLVVLELKLGELKIVEDNVFFPIINIPANALAPYVVMEVGKHGMEDHGKNGIYSQSIYVTHFSGNHFLQC